MITDLPKTLFVDGEEKGIYSDFRDIITICAAYNDSALSVEDRNYILLNNLFVDHIDTIHDKTEALKQAVWFVDGGKEYKEQSKSQPRLFDWEQDYDFIISAVDKNVKTVETVLDLPYLHWWTFLQKFSERKETRLDNIMGIREKLSKGEKLDKWEKELLRDNHDIIVLKDKRAEELEKELWG